MTDTAVDFFLENLKQLMACGEMVSVLSSVQNDKIKSLYEELGLLRKFLNDIGEKRHEHEELKKLVARIGDVTCEAEDKIDWFMLEVFDESASRKRKYDEIGKTLMLDNDLREIKSIQEEVKKISDKELCGIGDPQDQVGMSFRESSSRITAFNAEEETVIGFDQEVEMIKERLIDADVRKQLEVVSIVGMPGIGKTTLARKVYNDPFIVYHFHVRGWGYVSQVPRKRDLLLSILDSIVAQIYVFDTLSDERLGEELYKRLSGRRYLIVMDDIWHIQSWLDLKNYFPNNKNGSRVIFTSRVTDRALYAKPDSSPHFLRFLTKDESWDLLQQKIFGKDGCPPDFVEIGKQIAVKCQGLPLAIVVVAGLLAKTERTQDWWKQVAESLCSYILSDTEQCMDTLAISYNHLPHHLKSCFLYFGAFPEDYEIPVRKLIWLWIAEGFIPQKGYRNLEDVAEECLMDLIGRSLVLVAKKRSTGEIRTCRVHDLLRDLCLRKVKEENFLQQINVPKDLPVSQILNAKKKRRLCFPSHLFHYISMQNGPCVQRIRSLLCFGSEQDPSLNKLIINYPFRLLRVLDLLVVSMMTSYLSALSNLLLLRYLALRGKNFYLPPSISRLQNLETLISSQGLGPKELHSIVVPSKFLNLKTSISSQGHGPKEPLNIWKMVNLRHLLIAGNNDIVVPESSCASPLVLYNLQTLSQIYPSANCNCFLHRIPNLRKLGFCGNFSIGSEESWVPDLSFLKHLETLKLLNRAPYDEALKYVNSPSWNLQSVKFPPNLRRLTLSRTFLEWREMSILGMLPNLEALKLEFKAFLGPVWKTNEGGFRKLRFLRLYYMYMEQWDTCGNHFPSLQHLVLHECGKLMEIPYELGNVSTLNTIEVTHCTYSAVNSARKIQREQQQMGNDWLKIFIYPPDLELTKYS